MTATSETRVWDAVVTSTLEASAGEWQDNIYKSIPLLSYLRQADKIKKIDGGQRIKADLMYGKNSTVQSNSAYGLLDTTPQDGITAAFFDWKIVNGTLAISYLERRQNSAKHQMFDLIKAKEAQLQLAIKEEVTTQLLSDGTGHGGLDIGGLKLAIEVATPSTSFGGITPTGANSWWANQATGSFGSFETNDGLGQLRSIYRLCSRGSVGGSPDLIVLEGDIYDSFEAEHLLHLQFMTSGKANESMFNLGINNFKYKQAMVMEEEQLDSSGLIYLINTDYLKFAVDKDTDFKMFPAVTPSNQRATVAPMEMIGNIIVTNRRKLGVCSGASA